MKPKDLFIGAWVNYLHTEDGVAPYKEPICISADDISRDECVIEAHYEPIPITPKILIKNGFEIKPFYAELQITEGSSTYRVRNNLRQLGIKRDDGLCTMECPCSYVHQLQAGMRFCGIEKEIEL